MTDLALDLRSVSKTYKGRVRALDSISLQVRRGEVFGLLGPNGAGKSTLVKILTTVIRPTAAEGSVLGQPIGHKPTLARLGYLPEHHRFPEYLTGRQVVDHFGALAGTPAKDRRRRADQLLDFVGMRAWADQRVATYSKGMRQRVGLAQALVNDPDLVILDEPTDGVDPTGRRDIRAMIQSLKDRGTTVFLNSHLLSELELVADRVAILVKGRVSAQGTLDDLTRHSRRYDLVVVGPAPGWVPDWAAAEGFTSAPDPTDAALTRLSRPGDDPAHIQPVLDRLRTEGVTVVAVTRVRESLEDLFIRAVTDPTTGQTADPGADRPAAKGARP
jgi:ABC-2 type transport system ATP-binding protein